VKFAFVRDLDEEEQRKPRKERIPVSLMCEVLDVSRGGFYAWLARAESDRAKEDAELTVIKKIHDDHEGRLGIDRLVAELATLGRRLHVHQQPRHVHPVACVELVERDHRGELVVHAGRHAVVLHRGQHGHPPVTGLRRKPQPRDEPGDLLQRDRSPVQPAAGHDGDQVLQGAAEPGQLGDHEGVAFEEVFESLGQAWADGVFAGELVAVDALAAGFGQGVDLAVEVLVAPAGAGVADQVSSGGGGGEQAGFGFDGCYQPPPGGEKTVPFEFSTHPAFYHVS
jgi:hypothetical protein